jgi:endo-1,4-beta-D-glucanase Y
MVRYLPFLIFILYAAGSVCANPVMPQHPYPQEIDFPHTIKPSRYSQEELNTHVSALYTYYRDTYLRRAARTDNGYYIHSGGTNVDFNTTATVSEAHGYGMIIFALMAGYDDRAKEYFDGMYYFFKDHPSSTNSYLMSWEIEGRERRRPRNSATDGDMDIAYALILAHNQWGSEGSINYLGEARDMIIHGIQAGSMSPRSKRTLLGDWDTDHYTSRSSDWMTAHMRAYAEVTGDDFFQDAADTVYALIESIQSEFSPDTGLMPDFIKGRYPMPDPDGGGTHENNAEHYDWNACRYPWRIATDYMHYQTPEAHTVCSTIAHWVVEKSEGDPSRVVGGYSLDGEELVEYTSVAYLGPFATAVAADGTFENYLDDSWDIMRSDRGNGVYVTALNLFSMLLISGNWWVPENTTIEAQYKGEL